MLSRFLLMISLLLSPAMLEPLEIPMLHIWNVGQGLWTTLVTPRLCIHIDMGGERAPFQKVRALCGRRSNVLFLTHTDRDHISFIPWGLRSLPDLCLARPPREKPSHSAEKFLSPLPLCGNSDSIFVRAKSYVTEIEFEVPRERSPATATKSKQRETSPDRNEMSRIFYVGGIRRAALIPGDSTVAAEKIWVPLLRERKVDILVLGHHGSKTSTGEFLLRTLTSGDLGTGNNSQHREEAISCVASARKKRYGHPHPTVIKRLHEHGAAPITTEAWGNLKYEL